MDYLNYKIKIDVNAITNVDQIWFGSHYTKLANLCGWLYQRSLLEGKSNLLIQTLALSLKEKMTHGQKKPWQHLLMTK